MIFHSFFVCLPEGITDKRYGSVTLEDQQVECYSSARLEARLGLLWLGSTGRGGRPHVPS